MKLADRPEMMEVLGVDEARMRELEADGLPIYSRWTQEHPGRRTVTLYQVAAVVAWYIGHEVRRLTTH